MFRSSGILFTICINPFINMLEETLKTTRRGKHSSCPAVIAYADDVTVILRSRDVQQSKTHYFATKQHREQN
jgi:hypothetical protein